MLLKKSKKATQVQEDQIRFSIIPPDEYRIQYATRAYERIEKEMRWMTQIERIPVTITSYSDAMKKAFDRGVRWRAIAELTRPSKGVWSLLRSIERKILILIYASLLQH
jgi:hypothetical protein